MKKTKASTATTGIGIVFAILGVFFLCTCIALDGRIETILISGLFVLVGALIAIIPAVQMSKKKKLIETGARAEAVITAVDIDQSTRINHRHPYKAQCEVTDSATGEVYLYSSEGVMEDIRYLTGSKVTVYYDPYDRSKYYVDLDSAGGNAQIHDFR